MLDGQQGGRWGRSRIREGKQVPFLVLAGRTDASLDVNDEGLGRVIRRVKRDGWDSTTGKICRKGRQIFFV